MKIIGKSARGYLVEATETELLRAAGYASRYAADVNIFERGHRDNNLRTGLEIEFVEPTTRLRALTDQEAKVRQNAAMLRGLADMMEGLTPSQITLPTGDEPSEASNASS